MIYICAFVHDWVKSPIKTGILFIFTFSTKSSLCVKLNVATSFNLCMYFQGYGSDGLKLLSHEESVSFGESVLKLTFDPGTVEDGLLTVECKLDHPFYVKNKGTASIGICSNLKKKS